MYYTLKTNVIILSKAEGSNYPLVQATLSATHVVAVVVVEEEEARIAADTDIQQAKMENSK